MFWARRSYPRHTGLPPPGTLTAGISPPDASAFAVVSTLLDVYDASGQFVTGLSPQAVTAFEDSQPVPLESLEETNPGVQLVVAVNPSPALAVRDQLGNSATA